MKSKAFTIEVSKEYSLSKTVENFTKSDLLTTWFFLQNYGKFNNGRGGERWIIYRLWWKEKMRVTTKERRNSMITPTSKVTSEIDKKSKSSSGNSSIVNDTESMRELLENFGRYFDDFLKLEEITQIFLSSIHSKIQNYGISNSLHVNLMIECINIIQKADWKNGHFLFAIWRILKLEKENQRTFLECLGLYFQLKHENAEIFKTFRALRKISYLTIDGKSIFKIDIEELSLQLQQNDLQSFFSEYHIFGTQLNDFDKYYHDQSVMGPTNTTHMLEILKALEKNKKWNFVQLTNILHDEFCSLDKIIYSPLKYQYSLLIPKLQDDFTTFYDAKQSIGSTIYISSMENSNY
eukprot:gene12233-5819_t